MPRRNWVHYYWYLLVVPLVWIFVAHQGKLQFLKDQAMDWRFQSRGAYEVEENLIYLNIDTHALSEFGTWPWDRRIMGALLNGLMQFGRPKAVGVDVVYSPAGRRLHVGEDGRLRGDQDEGNAFLRQLGQVYPEIVFAGAFVETGFPKVSTYDDARLIRPPELPEFFNPRDPNIEVGLISDPAARSVIRRLPLFADAAGLTIDHYDLLSQEERLSHPPVRYLSLGLQLALRAWGVDSEQLEFGETQLLVSDTRDSLISRIPLEEKQFVTINWASPWSDPERNPSHSIADLAAYLAEMQAGTDEERAAAAEWFRQFNGAVVLIGPTDPLLQDLAPTPFDAHEVPKVGVHGNLFKTLVSGKFVRTPPPWAEYLLILAMTVALTFLAVGGGRYNLYVKLAGIPVVLLFIAVVHYAFSRHDVVIPAMFPLLSGVSTGFAAALMQVLLEQKQKSRIKNIFGSYVSPDLVNRMVESGEEPRLGGEETHITAFFSDVQSFSAFSEKLDPIRLVDLMNEYLSAMTDILTEEGGTLDKYIGDAIVSFFGAPVPMKDHALKACIASQRMHKCQHELRQKWAREGDKWPDIVSKMQTRIGLNTGLMVTGNMGSTKRFNYTMMGDNVNLAARCESGAKAYGVYTMVTEATKHAAEESGDDCLFRFLDRIVVMGRTQPVGMYEIVGLRAELPDAVLEGMTVFDDAIEHYLRQDWDGAIPLFRKAAQLELNQPGKTPGVKTNPSLLYIERCREMKDNPPGEGWDGVYVMSSK